MKSDCLIKKSDNGKTKKNSFENFDFILKLNNSANLL